MKEETRLLLVSYAKASYDTVASFSDYESEKDYHNISPFVRVRFYYSPDDHESWLRCFETDKEEWGEGHITDREWAKSLQYARALYYMSYQLNYPVQVVCTAVLEVRIGAEWVDLESSCIGGFDLYAYPNEEGLIYPIPIKEITHDYREEMVEAAVKYSQSAITKILEDQEKLTEALKELLND